MSADPIRIEIVEMLDAALSRARPEMDNTGRRICKALYKLLAHGQPVAPTTLARVAGHSPELIDEFLREWKNGYDVVSGKRTSREGESYLKVTTAKWFYRVINRLSDVEIPHDTGDFRLISRRALEALMSLRETHRYMKGLYAWIGFPHKEVSYQRHARAAGHSKWNYWRLWNFALEGITSFSDVPLKIATYLGILTSGIAFLYGLFFLIRTLLIGNPVPGYPSLVLIVLFLGGIQLICLGIIGEYLARTYNESKSRALYFVKGYHPRQNRNV